MNGLLRRPLRFIARRRFVESNAAFAPTAPEQKAGRKAFDEQRRKAAKRGIPFLFTFEEWWAWWQVDGRWERRGRRKDQLVMTRIGDTGPYAPHNVRALTPGQNARDIQPEVRAEAAEKARVTLAKSGRPRGWLLGVRGANHPRSRAVITPSGRFGSCALAAEFFGVSAWEARDRALNGRSGWRFDEGRSHFSSQRFPSRIEIIEGKAPLSGPAS